MTVCTLSSKTVEIEPYYVDKIYLTDSFARVVQKYGEDDEYITIDSALELMKDINKMEEPYFTLIDLRTKWSNGLMITFE